MEELNGLEIVACADPVEWEDWLAAHHDARPGVWLKIAKKSSGKASVTASEALDVCLCYGWIDSQRRGLDDDYFLQKYSPRRPKSSWSMVNIRRVEALTAAGRMRPPGLAQVAAAKADGRWDAAYESQRDATAPPDLVSALADNEPARKYFEQLGKTDQYLVILPLLKARTPEARAARLRKTITQLEAGKPPG